VAYLIGIDIGASRTTTLLCHESGKTLGSSTREYSCSHPLPGGAEQRPEDWWDAVVESVHEVLAKGNADGMEVKGIGLSGQMHAPVLLDENNEVLRPSILGHDARGAEECEEIASKLGAERLLEEVCNPCRPAFTAPKLLWVRNHEPEVYEKTAHVLLPKDYIRFRLTGEFATEASDASGTLLLDARSRRWSESIASTLEIDLSLLPACGESTDVTGKVSDLVADSLGIAAGTPVVGGASDKAADAVAKGVVRIGVVSAGLGMSGVVSAFSDEPRGDSQGRVCTFCHAVPGKWHVVGAMPCAGACLQWYRNELGDLERDQAKKLHVDAYDIICEEAEDAEPGCAGLIFLPQLAAESADAVARGGWIGLTVEHTKADMVRSVLEGVTYGMRDTLEAIRSMGIPINQIRITGGGAKNEFWRQIQANIYSHSVWTINTSEGPAFGAALLAGVGTGRWASVAEACDAMIRVDSETSVDPAIARIYDRYYPVFGNACQSLRDRLGEIARAVARVRGV